MAEPANTTTPETPAPAAATTPAPAVQTPAPAATTGPEEIAKLKADYERLLAHKQKQDADLAQYRAKLDEEAKKAAAEKAAIEARMRETGDVAGLLAAEKDRAAALAAQLADLTPKAERFGQHEKRAKEKIEAAKAAGDLPAYVVRSIDIAAASDADAALDILNDYREAQRAAAGKQPPPMAPPLGAPPPANGAEVIDLKNPSVAALRNLEATNPAAYRALLQGQTNGSAPLTIGQRLTGAFRK